MIACPVPIIAAVNGPVFAGGMEMALCCDFIYARRRRALRADRGDPGNHAGGRRHPEPAARSRRPARREILLTGKPYSAEEAYDWGMVNRICKPETLLEEALETATVIANNAPISTRQIKQWVDMGLNMDLHSCHENDFEIEAYNRMVADGGPARGHPRLQREAQAELQGALAETSMRGVATVSDFFLLTDPCMSNPWL